MNDVDAVMNWLRNPEDESLDPSGDFTRVDQMIPKKKGQKPKDRARDIESALDWMRNHDVSPDDEEFVDEFEKLGSIPMTRRTPEERSQEEDDIMNWLRSGKSESDDPTGDFTRVDQMLPKKKSQKKKDRARDIEGALDWMRSNGVSPADDAESTPRFSTLPSVQMSRRTPEGRKNDVDAIMNWLRNPEDDSLDQTGDFTKIDQMIPKKKGQKPQDR